MFDQFLSFAQQATPRLDSVYWVMLASRILHILGAIILVGGLFYIRAVLAPLPDREGQGDGPGNNVGQGTFSDADRIFGGRRAAWAKWVGIATLLLLVTGLWNYMQMIRMHERLASSYHMIAGIKMLTAFAVFFLAALLAGRSTAAQMLRKRMRLWLTVCLILAILTAVLGSVLRTYPRVPKLDAPAEPTQIAP